MDLIQRVVRVGAIRRIPLVLTVILMINGAAEKLWAASNHIATKYFNYKDSNNDSLWEHLTLFTHDLSVDTSVSILFGIDAVTSPSFQSTVQALSIPLSTTPKGFDIVTGASAKPAPEPVEEKNDQPRTLGVDEPEAQDITKYRYFGGASLSHHYTETFSGTTSFNFSNKSDYHSFTLGQTFNSPGWNDRASVGLGIYYTHNNNHPSVSTDDPALRPPVRDLASQQYSFLLSLEYLLNAKSKVKMLFETFNARGYLSNGYQLVPVTTGTESGEALEQLPDDRTGAALTAIYSRWLFNRAAVHIRARGYLDSFGIQAGAADTRFRTYINDQIIAEIGCRYYAQTAASFWGSTFPMLPRGSFTNHPSLAGFSALQYSAGLRYEVNPDILDILGLYGNINVNFDHYVRSNGFNFTTYSIGFETEF